MSRSIATLRIIRDLHYGLTVKITFLLNWVVPITVFLVLIGLGSTEGASVPQLSLICTHWMALVGLMVFPTLQMIAGIAALVIGEVTESEIVGRQSQMTALVADVCKHGEDAALTGWMSIALGFLTNLCFIYWVGILK